MDERDVAKTSGSFKEIHMLLEAGASLKALAKGAVQFSRACTFHKLWDWSNSLFYDPDVSSHTSSGIMELELSGPNSSSKIS